MRIITLIFVMVVSLMAATGVQASQSDDSAGDVRVLLGEDGSVKLVEPEPEVVEYTDTGFKVSSEAEQLFLSLKPDKRDKLLSSEEGYFVPVGWKAIDARMTGLLTWEKTIKVEKVLAKDGDRIIIRPPASSAERSTKTEQISRPFGLLALMLFGSLVVGNVVVRVKGGKIAAAALAALFAALFALAAIFAAAFAPLAAIFATIAALFAHLAAGVDNEDGNGRKAYHTLSGVAGASMVVAVLTVL